MRCQWFPRTDAPFWPGQKGLEREGEDDGDRLRKVVPAQGRSLCPLLGQARWAATGVSRLWGNPGSQAHSQGSGPLTGLLRPPGKPGGAQDRGQEDMDEGGSFRNQYLRDKQDTSFCGKHSLHIP